MGLASKCGGVLLQVCGDLQQLWDRPQKDICSKVSRTAQAARLVAAAVHTGLHRCCMPVLHGMDTVTLSQAWCSAHRCSGLLEVLTEQLNGLTSAQCSRPQPCRETQQDTKLRLCETDTKLRLSDINCTTKPARISQRAAGLTTPHSAGPEERDRAGKEPGENLLGKTCFSEWLLATTVKGNQLQHKVQAVGNPTATHCWGQDLHAQPRHLYERVATPPTTR
jgi:hypothetical protein